MPSILIIDDDEPSRFTLREIFEIHFPEFELLVFADSCHYAERLRGLSSRPELAIIDIYISTCPVGNEVALWLRQEKQFEGIKIIAFTADSFEVNQLLKEGFDAVIVKPIDSVERFIEQVHRVQNGESFVYLG